MFAAIFLRLLESLRNGGGAALLNLELLRLRLAAGGSIDMSVAIVVISRPLPWLGDLVLQFEVVVALLDVRGDGLGVADVRAGDVILIGQAIGVAV